jgi:hypothetical protein
MKTGPTRTQTAVAINPERYDDDGDGLGCSKQDDDDHVHGRSQDVN